MGRTSNARRKLMDAASALFWETSYNATTIDDICNRAGVRKGTFYHFYRSKSNLTLAALEDWRNRRLQTLSHIFRSENQPMGRILDYVDFVMQRQSTHFNRTGRVLGCPIFNLASEISTQDEQIRCMTAEMLNTLISFFESAIRDAQTRGDISVICPSQSARLVYHVWEATLTQCRIENDLRQLRLFPQSIKSLLGAPNAHWQHQPMPAEPMAASSTEFELSIAV